MHKLHQPKRKMRQTNMLYSLINCAEASSQNQIMGNNQLY